MTKMAHMTSFADSKPTTDGLAKEYKKELSKLNKIKRTFKNEHELLMEKSKTLQKKGEMLLFEEKDSSIFLWK